MKYVIIISSLILLFTPTLWAYDDNNFTDANEVGLTITNYGTIGHGFSIPGQPSCIFPLYAWRSPYAGENTIWHTEDEWWGVEHLYKGALWIAATVISDTTIDTLVTTGGIDQSGFTPGETEGYEFTPLSDMRIKSTLPTSPYYDPSAISEQDFICDYYDFVNTSPPDNHILLAIKVHQESYVWSYSYTSSFVIISYDITKIRPTTPDMPDTLHNIYLGFWLDTTVGNLAINNNYTSQPNRWDYYDDANGYAGNDGYGNRTALCYEWDEDTDGGYATSYVGVRLLGTAPIDIRDSTQTDISYNRWIFQTGPQDDIERYEAMSNGEISSNVAANYLSLLSVGPWETLAPDSTINLTIAIICGTDLNNLYESSKWARYSYDKDYILPAPPPSPPMTAISNDRMIKLYWTKEAEEHRDPSTGKKDFEGYGIFRYEGENLGSECYPLRECYELLAMYDIADDSLDYDSGYNTGMESIACDTIINGIHYDYSWPPAGKENEYRYLKNGFPYHYAILSYDSGDTALASSWSTIRQNDILIYPGAYPISYDDEETSINSPAPGVYPNPYRTSGLWDGASERESKIYFTNLPAKSNIYIYSLSGDLIATLEHDDPYNGEESWNLITDEDQAVATGLYLFAVEDLETGIVRTNKFLIIK